MSTYSDYQKRCYILGRYMELYRASGSFEDSAMALIQEGISLGDTSFLEHMIGRDNIYEEADRELSPILILKGMPICYGILNYFADQLANALDQKGYLVEIYDVENDGLDGLVDFVGKRFQAIIGFQIGVFCAKLSDGRNLFDQMIGPKFNMILDHPLWLSQHLQNGPEDYYVLTEDLNYVKAVEEYLPEIKRSFWIPPGEVFLEGKKPFLERSMDLSFLGSFYDWHNWLPKYEEINEKTGGLAERFKVTAEEHLSWTWEEDLEEVLRQERKLGHEFEKCDVIDLFCQLKSVCSMVMSKLRGEIIQELLEQGISIHVFGDSWNAAPFAKHPNLICHPEVSPENIPGIFADSKLALNIMSWHKAGMTERVAGIMLNGAVCVSDETSYLRDEYVDGEELLLFTLENYKELGKRLKEILANPKKMESMAECGRQKALQKESWEVRAEQILAAIREVRV